MNISVLPGNCIGLIVFEIFMLLRNEYIPLQLYTLPATDKKN